jgi:anthranilate 1,2-dioxygenase large subunit
MIDTRERSALDVVWPARYSQIPKEVFYRDDVYRLELERIFEGPEWHPVAHVAEIPNRGDVKAIQIGETPVLVVHGSDDRIRVFLNSCAHRGTQLQTCSRANVAKIECPFHRWVYSTEGELIGAPGSDGFPPTFSKAAYGLKQLRSEEVAGIILATQSDDAPDITSYLGETKDYFARGLGDGAQLKLLGYQKVLFSSNWKEYGDNDGYHAPLLHRAFRLMKWQKGNGTQSVTRYGHKFFDSEVHPPTSDFLNDMSLIEYRGAQLPLRSTIVNLFPGIFSIIRHLDVINVRFAFPHSPHATEVHYAYFSRLDDDEEMVRHRTRQAANFMGPSGFVSLEDGAVFNRLHRGSRTPGTIEFQKGVSGRIEPPAVVAQNDEASNLVKWDRYRELMGFAAE